MGFHGCKQEVADQVINNGKHPGSNNDYDWLGPGICFREGQDLYENAGFKDKSHIQISVVNPNATLGCFRP